MYLWVRCSVGRVFKSVGLSPMQPGFDTQIGSDHSTVSEKGLKFMSVPPCIVKLLT